MTSNPDRKSDQRRLASMSMIVLSFVTGLLLAGMTLLDVAPIEQRALAAETTGPIQLRPATPDRPTSFRDRLVTGLRARLKSEIAFIDTVVARVEVGELPQRLVDETFIWARLRSMAPRRGSRIYRPIRYFQPVMIARAGRIGVEL